MELTGVSFIHHGQQPVKMHTKVTLLYITQHNTITCSKWVTSKVLIFRMQDLHISGCCLSDLG